MLVPKHTIILICSAFRLHFRIDQSVVTIHPKSGMTAYSTNCNIFAILLYKSKEANP